MGKGTKTILGIVVVLVVALLLLAWSFLRGGFSARAKPSAMETSLARHARSMMTPASAKAMKNPYPTSPERPAEGREHWADHCAQCHGLDGSGNAEIGRNLYPPAPDMRAAST
jgi:mono/diheme cytochrome c family protein